MSFEEFMDKYRKIFIDHIPVEYLMEITFDLSEVAKSNWKEGFEASSKIYDPTKRDEKK